MNRTRFRCALSQIVVLSIPFSVLAADSATTQPSPLSSPLPALANTSVSLPWNELRQLLDRDKTTEVLPPVSFVFSAASYTAKVGAQNVSVAATCDLNLLTDAWTLVPLVPADSGVVGVTLDGAPAQIVLRDNTLNVLVNGTGKKHLSMTMEKAFSSASGSTRFDLPLLPSPIVAVAATLPGTNLDVKADGGAGVQISEVAGGATSLTASYRGAQNAIISWRPQSAQANQPARLYAETTTLVSVEDRLVRFHANVNVDVEQSPVKELRLRVADAPGVVVLGVTGSDVSQWKQESVQDGSQWIAVTFSQPVDHERTLAVVYERDVPAAGGELKFAPLGIDGAKRDRGSVAVETLGGFDVKPTIATATRVGVSDLPQPLHDSAKGSLQLAYQYSEQPAEISLSLAKPELMAAKVLATTATLVTVDRGVLKCQAQIDYEVMHVGVDTLRVGLPDGIELTATRGNVIRNTSVVTEGKNRFLIVNLTDLAKGAYTLTVDYEKRFDEAAATTQPAANAQALRTVTVPLLTNPEASQDRGFIGIEVRGGYEIRRGTDGAERIDVTALPPSLWQAAHSPLLAGYRYEAPGKDVQLTLNRYDDVSVLVAVSDFCEAATVYTPDGKAVTKMMYSVRNNLKQFMTMKLPEGAELWSAFVDDKPVTPVRNAAGDVLIPLSKSQAVDDDDANGYRAKRDERRSEQNGVAQARQQLDQIKEPDEEQQRDLKPYDVEIVYVMPAKKLEDRGELKTQLPQTDVPTGQLAWAVLLPHDYQVLDSQGNMKEVAGFSLPFRHFAEAALQEQKGAAQDAAKALASASSAMQQQAAQMAEEAKAHGVLPVRVEIPITGELYRFEKFLVVDEVPGEVITYRKRVE